MMMMTMREVLSKTLDALKTRRRFYLAGCSARTDFIRTKPLSNKSTGTEGGLGVCYCFDHRYNELLSMHRTAPQKSLVLTNDDVLYHYHLVILLRMNNYSIKNTKCYQFDVQDGATILLECSVPSDQPEMVGSSF